MTTKDIWQCEHEACRQYNDKHLRRCAFCGKPRGADTPDRSMDPNVLQAALREIQKGEGSIEDMKDIASKALAGKYETK
jgi:hypothetical protein